MGPQLKQTLPTDLLDRWKDLSFTFDLDKMDPPNPPNRPPQGSKSREELADVALLVQLAELARLSSQDSSMNQDAYTRALQAMQHPSSSTLPYYPQLHNTHHHHLPSFPQGYPQDLWSQFSALDTQHPHSSTNAPHHSPGANFHLFNHQPTSTQAFPVASSSTSPPDTSSPTSNSPVGPDAEGLSTLEDKRKRNTEASARFRIKKKQKSLNLQRSVADLTGRADELEKEAAELRRENGWLKEIIMLKSNRLTDLAKTVEAYHGSTSASANPSSQGGAIQDKYREEDTDDGSEYEEVSGKGKGKQKAKPTKRKKN